MSLPANEIAAEIAKHQGMVKMMAKGFAKYGVEFEDLVQEGNLGLLRAAEKFDPTPGFKFLSYATWWIRSFMGQAVERAHGARNEHTRKVFWRGKKAKAVLEAQGLPVTNEDIARIVGVDVKYVENMEDIARPKVRLDLHTFFATDDGETIEEIYNRTDEMKKFLVRFERITKKLKFKPRDWAIFKLHYVEGWSYTAICKRYAISRQRCETIGKLVVQRIRRNMEIA